MDFFNYRDGRLHAEEADLREIVERFGTPCYVYSRAALEHNWLAFDEAFGSHPHLICYSVKANSSLALLDVLARLGSGFDIVSVGELERVLAAGGDASKIVFSGVGKQAAEIERALEAGIYCFNVESAGELERINLIAGKRGQVARISVRVNPDVDAKTHPYISTGLKDNKFGIDINEVEAVYRRARELPHIEVDGIDCHIGSQLTQLEPFIDALDRVLQLASRLEQQGVTIRHLDLGGGLGIRYDKETPPLPLELISTLLQRLRGKTYKILLEPGRAIVGNAGMLLTRVEYLKHTPHKHFAVVDAAMNDLLRPSLYKAWMDIAPLNLQGGGAAYRYDIVGPVCETGDFLGKDRELALAEGDLLAIRSAGAYGFVMSSNYNTRPRPPEVMVDGANFYLVRPREELQSLWATERLLAE
ncbi:MAG TPA: diaminopimelate decarboxylase [Gammaproteobacteria bacterium]|nr:diaminopimelate decarboxylase [Gammaproteobacteria bacterium]